MSSYFRLLAPLLLLLWPVACTGPVTSIGIVTDLSAAAPKQTLMVFAAASLVEPMQAAAPLFEAMHPGVRVVFNFAGSQHLRSQLELGARADVFASANPEEMQAVIEAGLTGEGSARVLAGNRLVVIVPADNPAQVSVLADLADPGLKLAMADEAVPAGRYSRRMLERLSRDPAFGDDFGRRVLQNVVSLEQSVSGVVTKVALGEVDAGVAYATDVNGSVARPLIALEIPGRYNETAVYLVAPLAGASHPSLAEEFVDFLLSGPGQALLRTYGLLPADSNRGDS